MQFMAYILLIACVADTLNLLYRDGLYKWFRRVRGPAATQANYSDQSTVYRDVVLLL